MTAIAKQDTREVARPLKVLEKLIKEDIEAGEKAGMDYYRSAGDKLNEARDGHYRGDVTGFWEWATDKFGKSRETLRRYMALGAEGPTKQFKTLEEVGQKVFGYSKPISRNLRRDWVNPIDDIAERARNEARRLAAQEELTRKQERDAEEKLGRRLIAIGFRVLAQELHPDKGGSREAMARLSRVRDRLLSNV